MDDKQYLNYINSLPEGHWRDWHAEMRRVAKKLDDGLAQGMTVEEAADYASA